MSLQSFNAPDPDPELTVKQYERTAEHNEELGLDHMNTECSTTSWSVSRVVCVSGVFSNNVDSATRCFHSYLSWIIFTYILHNQN